MKTVIVFDHPYTIKASENQPHFRSYSAAIAKEASTSITAHGGEVDLIDLHADHFDPVMHQADLENWRTKRPINAQAEDYYQRLASADRIIFIFPIWWEVMPAMTKGFIDKVLTKYHYAKKSPHVLPRNPEIDVLTVSGTPTPLYRLIFGNPVTKALKRGTFGKLGLRHYHWQNFNPEHQTEIQRQKALKKVDRLLKA
ncbi:NAD(P)H-dependent oxidoreductase [Levilactobacillus bambusae]|uniref:NADPH:quinone reductase n=1 Tax=Levilactobacillus bambusae TaxID=2024736 RepID=A0A2V1MZU7_9LACO|nr:NAD(P)H-dependent oxidoreductase [Levilactobacillus bambusae]PWG00342.1 NADPH:quinone reductase [Levilactobacillus bambusae]